MRRAQHRFLSFFLLWCFNTGSFAQIAPDTYWVQFSDKDNTPYSLSQPEQFLSQRAMDRRAAYGIAYDELDLPVDPAFIAAVLATGDVQLLNRSKWFNAITIRTTDHAAMLLIQDLPFVQVIRSRSSAVVPAHPSSKFAEPTTVQDRDGEEYGPSFLQIDMLNGQELHALGAKGQGMLIGVLDSGFDGVDSALTFQPMRDRGGLVLTRDLVAHDGDVFQDHWHGRSVLSTMAGVLDGQLLGTAPEADYVLLRTEDAGTEFPVEEDNWISGAELADSLGCDVLNTSLGYTTFDDSTMDHTYAELDGQTLRISIAANIAAQKGMIPVCSAGNNGSSDWHYISAPADATGVLTVGAVGDVENYAPFSSHGPSADGRVKPDVCAMGWGSTILRSDVDSVVAANGTSFASPILAGLVACLWQLHPDRTNEEIMDAVRQSASFFNAPSDSLGYGVPDFGAAHALLEISSGLADVTSKLEMHMFPVPFRDELYVQLPVGLTGQVQVSFFDPTGRLVRTGSVLANTAGVTRIGTDQVGSLSQGAYVVQVRQRGRVWQQRLIKAP